MHAKSRDCGVSKLTSRRLESTVRKRRFNGLNHFPGARKSAVNEHSTCTLEHEYLHVSAQTASRAHRNTTRVTRAFFISYLRARFARNSTRAGICIYIYRAYYVSPAAFKRGAPFSCKVSCTLVSPLIPSTRHPILTIVSNAFEPPQFRATSFSCPREYEGCKLEERDECNNRPRSTRLAVFF